MTAKSANRRTEEVLLSRLRGLAGSGSSTRQYVRIATAKLLEGIPCAPTDLSALATRLGVDEITEDPDLPVHGELQRKPKGFRIVYSKHLPRSRRRFTIAHELGHAILASTGPRAPQKGKAVERVCDMFAAEILVPTDELHARTEGGMSIDSVLQLANVFDASPQVMARRCAEVFRAAAFEFRDRRVSWKTHGLQTDSEELRGIIKEVLSSGRVTATVYLSSLEHDGRWRVEGRKLNGSEAALFLLSPAPLSSREPWGVESGALDGDASSGS